MDNWEIEILYRTLIAGPIGTLLTYSTYSLNASLVL